MVDGVVADLVILNGKVVTMDPVERVVEAVARTRVLVNSWNLYFLDILKKITGQLEGLV